tara:strand:- start:338 stop:1204 length:867 start_codon:yes stop_codon:yes gene_type:complete
MRIYLFYTFLIILLSCSEDSFAGNQDDSSIVSFGSNQTLDIITWNIEWFPKHENTISYVSDFILTLSPDIVALQEISDQYSFDFLIESLGEGWVGFRDNTDYQELSYIINLDQINLVEQPYTILDEHEYYFAYRPPYVLNIEFNNQIFFIIDIHLKCCDGSENRRMASAQYLKNYVDMYHDDDNVIILGDFNDELTDPPNENVFLNFLNDSVNYFFTDLYIAEGSSNNWSFPNWPSHLDHILVTNEVLDFDIITNTIKLDNYMIGGWNKYDNYISDHRPVGINLLPNQ